MPGVGTGMQSPMSAGCLGDAGKVCSCVTLGKSPSLADLVHNEEMTPASGSEEREGTERR